MKPSTISESKQGIIIKKIGLGVFYSVIMAECHGLEIESRCKPIEKAIESQDEVTMHSGQPRTV
jgi:hypothetical protein